MAHGIDRPVNLNNSLAAMKAKPQSAVPHLAERIDQLSIKRQEIIRPILEHPREYVLLSVRALAKRLGNDPATSPCTNSSPPIARRASTLTTP